MVLEPIASPSVVFTTVALVAHLDRSFRSMASTLPSHFLYQSQLTGVSASN